MNKNIYVLPVGFTFREIKYPEPEIPNKDILMKRLKLKKAVVKIGKELKGGTVSQVYEGEMDGTPVVVKHTENTTPENPHEFFIPNDGGNTDAKILKLLNKVAEVKTPKLILHFPKLTTHIMEDVRSDGFQLLSDKIIKKKLPLNTAEHIGRSLANLAKASREWMDFRTNESAQISFYERAAELLVAFPNNLKLYYALEKRFTQYDVDPEKQEKLKRFFVWPDCHPKNMLVNRDGEVVFIDFGRSHWGDQRYMLPNFLAHIVLYALNGYIKRSDAEKFVQKCIKSYRTVETYEDEKVLVEYLATELMHRAHGKYLTGIEKAEYKLLAWQLGMKVFDEKINTVKKFLSVFKKVK